MKKIYIAGCGGMLDDYGAHINALGFWAEFGFYSAYITVLFFFYAADPYQYAY